MRLFAAVTAMLERERALTKLLSTGPAVRVREGERGKGRKGGNSATQMGTGADVRCD